MYILYWEKTSGAIAPQVMLEEIGASYKKHPVDMAAGAHRSETYRAICPTARVPALGLEDGSVIGETAAIILRLGEEQETRLVPGIDDPDRARFLFWLVAMATGGYPTFSRACHPEQFTDDDFANETVARVAERQLADFFDVIEGAISGSPFFLEQGYTALDIYLVMLTEWIGARQQFLAERPRLAALCNAVEVRPAYARVAAEHGLRAKELDAAL